MKYVKIIVQGESTCLTIQVKKWMLQVILTGILIGIIVAANVVANPLMSHESVKIAVWAGVVFWFIVGTIVWSSHGVDEEKRPVVVCQLARFAMS